jgi:hypothetical protein
MAKYPVRDGNGAVVVAGYEVDATPTPPNDISDDYPVLDGNGATIIPDRGIVPATIPADPDTSGRTDVSRYPVLDGAGNVIIADRPGGDVGPVTDPGVTAIQAEGWKATFTSPPTFDPEGAPQFVVVDSPGYDTAGLPVTRRRTIPITKRIRQPYPNHATLTASDVALSHYVYAGDSIVGAAANDSAVPYPKVIADWALPPKRHCPPGGTLAVEVVALHAFARNGRPVACVRITGTPSSGSPVTRTATWQRSADGTPCYRAAFPFGDFTPGQDVSFTFACFPWIGDASAVRDTSAGSFPSYAAASAPQVHWWGAPPSQRVAFVSVSGNDGTGAVQSSLAAARAAPFASLAAALQALVSDGGANLSGARLVIGAGTHSWPSASPTGTRLAPDTWFSIEGDPDDPDPRTNCVVQAAGTSYIAPLAPAAGAYAWARIAHLGVGIPNGSYGFISGTTSRTWWWFDDVTFHTAMAGGTAWSSAAVAYVTGGSWTRSATGAVLPGASTNLRLPLVRGVSTNAPASASLILSATADASALSGTVYSIGSANLRAENLMLFNSRLAAWLGNTAAALGLGVTPDFKDIAVVQCDFEASNGAINPCAAFGENFDPPRSHDNILFDYVTTRGGTDQESLRINIHNDPNAGGQPASPSGPQASYRNVFVRRCRSKWIAIKDDVFDANGNLVQGWAKMYGVGWRDLSSARSPDNFAGEFFGLNSLRASAAARLIPAGAEHHGLDWDLSGAARPSDGSAIAGAVAA